MDQAELDATVAVNQHDIETDGDLLAQFRKSRAFTMQIASPLSAEDCSIQSMDDASPTRWHMAHTTWFFETFLLKGCSDYTPLDPRFESLFNSYYNAIGKQFPRGKRGLISRPGLEEVFRYRHHVDQEMKLRFSDKTLTDEQKTILQIGINHEQQHQELMLTDIKHALSCNPVDPIYLSAREAGDTAVGQRSWVDVDAGVISTGHEGDDFCFDNERPRHRVFLEPFQIADRCVTNRDYLAFIDDGGYSRPEFWLSLGWGTAEKQNWMAPLYWSRDQSEWSHFTLSGRKSIVLDEPVCHVSYFEADAYARWAGCRLATEAEWEHVVASKMENPFRSTHAGNWSDRLIDAGMAVHPQPDGSRREPESSGVLRNAMGNLWEWTSSHYSAYPGYMAPAGALGEYNGKFMCNAFVLKGGSCATPSLHARPTYRNFFSPESRWQFTGIRLARS